MSKLKWFSVLTIITGILFIIYGWTQSWSFSAESTVIEKVLMERTVRTYVFVVGGIIFITIGMAVELLREHFRTLENQIIELYTKGNRKI